MKAIFFVGVEVLGDQKYSKNILSRKKHTGTAPQLPPGAAAAVFMVVCVVCVCFLLCLRSPGTYNPYENYAARLLSYFSLPNAVGKKYLAVGKNYLVGGKKYPVGGEKYLQVFFSAHAVVSKKYRFG